MSSRLRGIADAPLLSAGFRPFGFLLSAAAGFYDVSAGAGLHAWMAGAAGVMTLAVMSRATLGHTGQALHASNATLLIYVMIVIAALLRIGAVLLSNYAVPLLHAAALAWVLALVGFAICMGRF